MELRPLFCLYSLYHQIYKMTILNIGGGTIAYFYTCIIEVKQFKQIK